MERTHNRPEPDRTPRENRVCAETADNARCRADYESGKDVREAADAQWTRRNR
ncbi:hypothetical protein [Streptomyces abikoensis]|uniref:Uncharacterized protein n=1 Tax=Streptomyces abikoensis TaxID=97398 RepID=A0ABW7TCT9_9ACTN